jgi:hypothetical protein
MQQINKYDINWQITRCLAKKEKSLEKKLELVNNFFNSNLSIENQERCLNWLEGLLLGYKRTNPTAVIRIRQEIEGFKSFSCLNKEEVKTEEDRLNNACNIPLKQRIELWKDLFKRNEKWLSKGYYHKQQNDFLEFLYLTLEDVELGNYSYQKLKQLQRAASTVRNTYKFLF